MLSRNFCVLVNFPKQVPSDTRLSRGMLVATFSSFSLWRVEGTELERLPGRQPSTGWHRSPPQALPAASRPVRPRPRSPQVVDAVAVQAEAVGAIGPVHQQLDVLADAAGTDPVSPVRPRSPLPPPLPSCHGSSGPRARSPSPRHPVPGSPSVPGPSLSSQLLEDRPRLRLRQRPHLPAPHTRGRAGTGTGGTGSSCGPEVARRPVECGRPERRDGGGGGPAAGLAARSGGGGARRPRALRLRGRAGGAGAGGAGPGAGAAGGGAGAGGGRDAPPGLRTLPGLHPLCRVHRPRRPRLRRHREPPRQPAGSPARPPGRLPVRGRGPGRWGRQGWALPRDRVGLGAGVGKARMEVERLGWKHKGLRMG